MSSGETPEQNQPNESPSQSYDLEEEPVVAWAIILTEKKIPDEEGQEGVERRLRPEPITAPSTGFDVDFDPFEEVELDLMENEAIVDVVTDTTGGSLVLGTIDGFLEELGYEYQGIDCPNWENVAANIDSEQ